MRTGRWVIGLGTLLAAGVATAGAQSACDQNSKDPRYQAARGSTNAYSGWNSQDTLRSRQQYQERYGGAGQNQNRYDYDQQYPRQYGDSSQGYGNDGFYRDRSGVYGRDYGTYRDNPYGSNRDWSGQSTDWRNRDTNYYGGQSDRFQDRERRYNDSGWQGTSRYGQYDASDWQRSRYDGQYVPDRRRSDSGYGTWDDGNHRDRARTRSYSSESWRSPEASRSWGQDDDIRNIRRTDRSPTNPEDQRNNAWNTRTYERDASQSAWPRHDSDAWQRGDSDAWRGSGAARGEYDQNSRRNTRSSDRDDYRSEYRDPYGSAYNRSDYGTTYDSDRYRDDYNRRYNQYQGERDWNGGWNGRPYPMDGSGSNDRSSRSTGGYDSGERRAYGFGDRGAYDYRDSFADDGYNRSGYRPSYRNFEGDYDDRFDEDELDEQNRYGDYDWTDAGARSTGYGTSGGTYGFQTGSYDTSEQDEDRDDYWDDYEID